MAGGVQEVILDIPKIEGHLGVEFTPVKPPYVIRSTEPGRPAAKLGILPGDEVRAVLPADADDWKDVSEAPWSVAVPIFARRPQKWKVLRRRAAADDLGLRVETSNAESAKQTGLRAGVGAGVGAGVNLLTRTIQQSHQVVDRAAKGTIGAAARLLIEERVPEDGGAPIRISKFDALFAQDGPLGLTFSSEHEPVHGGRDAYVVRRVAPKSQASAAGCLAEDWLLAVDGEEVAELSFDEIAKRLKTRPCRVTLGRAERSEERRRSLAEDSDSLAIPDASFELYSGLDFSGASAAAAGAEAAAEISRLQGEVSDLQAQVATLTNQLKRAAAQHAQSAQLEKAAEEAQRERRLAERDVAAAKEESDQLRNELDELRAAHEQVLSKMRQDSADRVHLVDQRLACALVARLVEAVIEDRGTLPQEAWTRLERAADMLGFTAEERRQCRLDDQQTDKSLGNAFLDFLDGQV